MNKLLLNDNWSFRYRDVFLKGQKVPFSMYSVMLDNGLMDDPFFRDNEYAATEMSRFDCEAEKIFYITPEFVRHNVKKLILNSVDTIADIYVNNKLLGSVSDMHHKWEFDLDGIVNEGENTLKIYFHSPIEYIERHDEDFQREGVANLVGKHARIRKTSSMSGWDWGPNLPDMGIYKDIELIGYSTGRLIDVYVRQIHQNGSVKLEFDIEADMLVQCEAAVQIFAPDGTVMNAAVDGLKAELIIEEPQLWWPNGYGRQPLYTIRTSLISDEQVQDSSEIRIGLRTISLATENDEYGREFCFVVNGIKIFSMGSNYIPEDSIMPRRSREKSEKLIRSCIDANHNMVRIWGGGYYVEDYFLDLCDEYGLLIWHDHMFACTGYLLTPEYRENVIAEGTESIKRMRNHPCMALFCGNNEVEAVFNDYGHVNNERLKHDYIEIFETILPKLSKELAPDIPYWSSSPSSGGSFDNPNDFNRGDTHNWDVWHGGRPYTQYRQHFFRFCSEYGFESFPDMKTIKAFTRPEDLNPFSKVMEDHQKCMDGNGKILNYLSQTYQYPYSFENLVYASQLMQADAIRYGVEHFRRYRGRCMGSLYWQLNDCWPVCSWSSIDYYGRWKALHYYSRRFYAPVLLSAHEDGFKVVLNISNETMNSFTGTIKYGIYDNRNNPVYTDEIKGYADKLSSNDIAEFDFGEYLEGHTYERYLAYELIDENDALISSASMIFAKPKHFNYLDPGITVSCFEQDGKTAISLSSKAYASGVCVDFDGFDAILSDNYFDIAAGNAVTIYMESCSKNVTPEDVLSSIRIKSLWHMSK